MYQMCCVVKARAIENGNVSNVLLKFYHIKNQYNTKD